MEMTITRALAELKLYDDKINKKINNTVFIAAGKKSSTKVNQIYTKDEFANNVKADLKSINDMIRNRNLIKAAIVNSNAVTEVEIAGKKMFVSTAIERKTSIAYEKKLLSNLKSQYRSILSRVEGENSRVQASLDSLLNTVLGKSTNQKASDSEIESVSQPYLEQHEWEVINPENIHRLIDDMEKTIEEFESEVDFVLSESNTITKISVEI